MPKVTTKRYRNMRYKPYGTKKKKRVSKSDPLLLSNWTPGLSGKRAIYGFPSQITTTLRYCDIISLNAVGIISKNVFRMNSLFDPDQSGVGHQPYFFDQISTQYNRYVVLGSKLTATFITYPQASGAARDSMLLVGVVGDNNGTTSGVTSTIMELQTSNTAMLGPSTGGPNQVTLTSFYSPEKSLGIDREDDTVSGLVTADPAKVWFATVFAQEQGAAAASQVFVKIQIEYTARFYDPVEPTGS